jgi:hypothetical protein
MSRGCASREWDRIGYGKRLGERYCLDFTWGRENEDQISRGRRKMLQFFVRD